MYQLNERGSIHRVDLDFLPVSHIKNEVDVFAWSADVQSLAEASNARPDMGPLASQVASEVELRTAYLSKTVSFTL
jgi:hypothetical protein